MANEVAIILLNYNTWQLTINIICLIRKISQFDCCDLIVIDNCSSNDSYKELQRLKDGKYPFELLCSEKNGGYASGNNIGLRYVLEGGYCYAWVINNDIEFPDNKVLDKMKNALQMCDDIAVVSPDVYLGKGHYLCNRELKRPSFWDLTLGMGYYKKKGRCIENVDEERGCVYGYRPQGCCMLLDVQKCSEVDFLDENTFLYFEEAILAERLLRKGYRCGCCTETSIIHNHSFTVKSSLSQWRYIKILNKSFDYLLKEYREFGLIKRMICSLFLIGKELVLYIKRK